MELKEAIEQLKDLQEDRKSFAEDSEEQDSIFMQDYEAIETVLQELDRLHEENEELSCVKKAIKVYKTDVGTENCQFVLMSENEFLNSFNYKCVLDDYISKNEIKDCLDDIENYFENVSVPYEDIEFIKEKRKDLLKEE